ncbi:MAG TPA: cytochrome P450 [Pyrinomonadaceae bacterium]|jgi:cytochrome P450
MKAIPDALGRWLTSPLLLRPVFASLRFFAPVLIFGNKVVLSRHADVIEVLERKEDFTVSEINAQNINRHDGPFILGMDVSEQYEREEGLLREAVRRTDLDLISSITVENAATLIREAQSLGRIDVVNGFARVVAARLVISYFGVPAPEAGEGQLMNWLRDIFFDVFLNFTNDRQKREAAIRSGKQLRQHLDDEIARRNALPATPAQADDVLGRLLALKGPLRPWLDDDTVRRNLSGLIVGAVETTSKFVALAMNELLRRPETMKSARRAALDGDTETVRRYAYESGRFNPHTPFMLRYCRHESLLRAGSRHERRIPAGSFVLLGTISAMFDPSGFPSPRQFRIDREPQSEYLHFGFGMHRCFGYYINSRQIPELVAALLRLPDLRRAPGRAGRISFAGPFPDRFVLEFDGNK